MKTKLSKEQITVLKIIKTQLIANPNSIKSKFIKIILKQNYYTQPQKLILNKIRKEYIEKLTKIYPFQKAIDNSPNPSGEILL